MFNDGKRNRRKGTRAYEEEGLSVKKALYIAGTILAFGILAFIITVMVYNDSLDKVYEDLGTRELGELTLTEDKDGDTEVASSSLRKDN